MCRAVSCQTCGKTTWAGCGQHIAAVRRQVPANQWCGHPNDDQGSELRRPSAAK